MSDSKNNTAKSPGITGRILRILFAVFIILVALTIIAGWAGTMMAGAYAPHFWLLLVLSISPMLSGLVLVIATAGYLQNQTMTKLKKFAFNIGIVGVAPLLWQTAIGPLAYPVSVTQMQPSATIIWPLDVTGRVGWGGDNMNVNNHVSVPDQRWAYDIVVEPAYHKAKSLAQYGCFGKPVLAPVDGVIGVAADGFEDHQPLMNPPLNKPLGNHVSIKMTDTQTWLIIAHLQKGSIKVKAGDTVKAGQQIAACGNSGHSTEPHVHIHHQRQALNARPLSFAEGLPLYFDSPDGPIMPKGGFSDDGKMTGATIEPVKK